MASKAREDDENRPWATVPPTGPVLRPEDAAEYLGISVTTYYDQAGKGMLPSPFQIGVRATGVPRPWLDAVVTARALQAGAWS